jgi:inosine-uridine nucleoside N-ribohydrolase
MRQVHLDTDLGGDPDDACALGMLLGLPDVEVNGVTTTIDPGGRRAGYARHCLGLLGRLDVPLAAGAEVESTHGRPAKPYGEGYWPPDAAPLPGRTDAALDLLAENVERGATVVAIGPFTNLGLLEHAHPGTLARADVVVMGGWTGPPRHGLPPWGPERDWNVQWDPAAAATVAQTAGALTLTPLPTTLQVHLRRADLQRLRATGRYGELLADQSERHAVDSGKAALGPAYDRLPDDLLNFHHDPLAAATAVGWAGVTVERAHLRAELRGDILHWVADPSGRDVAVVTDADGPGFTSYWLDALERAQTQ